MQRYVSVWQLGMITREHPVYLLTLHQETGTIKTVMSGGWIIIQKRTTFQAVLWKLRFQEFVIIMTLKKCLQYIFSPGLLFWLFCGQILGTGKRKGTFFLFVYVSLSNRTKLNYILLLDGSEWGLCLARMAISSSPFRWFLNFKNTCG